MSSVKELTGGTGDVNPQQLFVVVAQGSIDSSETVEVPLPIPRLSNAKPGRAIVLEVLKIHTTLDPIFRIDPLVASQCTQFVSIGTDLGNLAVNSTTVFFRREINQITSSTSVSGAGGGFAAVSSTEWADLTDGAGHGYLVATDSIGVRYDSVATGVQTSCQIRLFYRFKEVSLQEYIGIVQSQQ
jgi:hypothetical protein